MAEEYIMIHDIIEGHSERISNLKKYYPYFKLAETTFQQFKEGRYAELDMGYIMMAVLRFFIEENNFKEKDVIYEEYEKFVCLLLKRDFEIETSKEELKEVAGHLFEKLVNEGRPFAYTYFDPSDRKRKTVRMKLIESEIRENTIYYTITSEAIEFYLDTKELKEESTISVEQLLLEKLIDSQNFRGAAEVVKRINQEVRKLQIRKNEVLGLLSMNVFEGRKAYEGYVQMVAGWFEEEQKLFVKNSELIHKALEKAERDSEQGIIGSQYYKAFDDIFYLEKELKKAFHKHSELLQMCTDLQVKADEITAKAKFGALRNSFDFKNAMMKMMEEDRPDYMEPIVMPLLNLNMRKTFQLHALDDLLTYHPDNKEITETVGEGKEQLYEYEDEIEEERIQNNYGKFLEVLFLCLTEWDHFTLEEYQERLKDIFTQAVFKNGDYYSFLIHMSQKKEYKMEEILIRPDTFFEQIAADYAASMQDNPYRKLSFRLKMGGEDSTIRLHDLFEISNIIFERVGE